MYKDKSYVPGKQVVCQNCGAEMVLDDINYNFKGCQDEYWLCEQCQSSFFIKVRYGKVCSRKFSLGESGGLD